jgi:hypothetical protein
MLLNVSRYGWNVWSLLMCILHIMLEQQNFKTMPMSMIIPSSILVCMQSPSFLLCTCWFTLYLQLQISIDKLLLSILTFPFGTLAGWSSMLIAEGWPFPCLEWCMKHTGQQFSKKWTWMYDEHWKGMTFTWQQPKRRQFCS